MSEVQDVTMAASSSTNTGNGGAGEVELPEELVNLALGLLQASKTADLETIKTILDKGAPAWYQDTELGWSCLHYAAERREPEIMQALLKGGAVWNAVDKWGRTAGEISLSLGDREGWEIIRNEGIRSGMSVSFMVDM
jgi:protein arginine N-methyltransferase 2